MDKKYDVYGIGNALVDMEFEVAEDFLEKHNVTKGVMTLVDEDTQARLIDEINHEETIEKPGGSAANTIFAVSQFGGKGFYSCKVANDRFGDIYLEDMNEAGIDTNFKRQEREDGITGKCLVMVTDDAERTMNTYLGITSNLSTKEIDEQAIQNSEYVYIEGYLVASDKGYEAMKKTKEIAEQSNVKTTLTLSDPAIVEGFKGRFEEIVGASVDLLFCNEEEAKIYTGKDDLMEAREALKKEAKRFVITQGKNGAMIYDGDTFVDIEPYDVNAIDTNGAGDMYAGAFLYGITNGMGYAGAGKLASLAGSRIVSQFGPRLKWHEVQEIKNEATSTK
ncbi:Sugar or nucleoside kinase, ribokinase family [Fodinibius salinus]|uniref:Sugar or nucleoside kinase, ribokinase family n=1 Tax=Fodinibius salinus TaxID=860790 RepID=A0A5D3YMZ0_9BACT|nr:adenosine kinase [Fodinibius salinus]TYP94071.1 Sugar or nucleoside kinase, ribokinase family [Fodinibius salinus]